ncbi:hypothetical protein I302_108520 [Kwoniella bestiolae CBS 10118]|uniref:BRCT domain-containing protein n=1 Tax=Kwoniella bestiolae CBS 10118 TaxID=1296100 RepID=A0A1B9FVH3_9TREE|nr:hypothetical protein I302_07106 [Kwoniella bestiolae CBS 10118]OCF22765.1 hypothetical protein I302_07106 [Kwoniella bestiolae CBS 10118]
MSSHYEAGLFEGMVFYVHSEGRTYEGSGKLLLRIKEEIMTNGGDIEYSPENPSVTHILVPPDKEIKARDSDKSSLVNLHSTRFHKFCKYDLYTSSANSQAEINPREYLEPEDEEYFMERENERQELSLSGEWDVPKLLEHFGQCISASTYEEIRGAEKPVLRYGWVRKCVEYSRVLQEQDDDWGGQILRGRVLETFKGRIPRYNAENQPLMIQDTEMSGRKISQEHLEFAKNMNSGSRPSISQQAPGPSKCYQPRDQSQSHGHASKSYVNRWNHLAKHTYPPVKNARHLEPDIGSTTSPSEASLSSVAFKVLSPGQSTSFLNEPQLGKPGSPSHANQQDGQKPPDSPLTPLSLQHSPPLAQAHRSLSSIPTLAPDPRKPVKAVKVASEGRARPTAPSSSRPSGDKLFVHDNIPLTFAVYGGNYTMEYCIKAGGGCILPPDRAQYLILPRPHDQSDPKPDLTIEEKQVMNEVAQRGGRQRVVSSLWIDRCLKKQRLSAYQRYIIARAPVVPKSIPSLQETKNVGGSHVAETASDETDGGANGTVTSPGSCETNARTGEKRMRDFTPPMSPIRKRRKVEENETARSTDDHHEDMTEHSHTGSDPADSEPRTPVRQPVRVDEIEEGISLLAEGLREWDMKVASRTRFLLEFERKHNYQDWFEFFKKHETKVLSRFREMGYTYLHEGRKKGC